MPLQEAATNVFAACDPQVEECDEAEEYFPKFGILARIGHTVFSLGALGSYLLIYLTARDLIQEHCENESNVEQCEIDTRNASNIYAKYFKARRLFRYSVFQTSVLIAALATDARGLAWMAIIANFTLILTGIAALFQARDAKRAKISCSYSDEAGCYADLEDYNDLDDLISLMTRAYQVGFYSSFLTVFNSLFVWLPVLLKEPEAEEQEKGYPDEDRESQEEEQTLFF